MSRMESSRGRRRARRQFSDEFMAGAVRLVLDEGKTVGAVARELDLTPSSLGNWVKQARADRTKGKTGLTTEERAELTRLRKENRELRMERDVLKSRPSSRRTTGEVRVDPDGEGHLPRREALSLARGDAERLLRLAHTPGVDACAR